MEQNPSQDNEIINKLIDESDVHYKQKPGFSEFLKKAASYLRQEYDYALDEYIRENQVYSLESFFDAWKNDLDPIQTIDDFLIESISAGKKKMLDIILKNRKTQNNRFGETGY